MQQLLDCRLVDLTGSYVDDDRIIDAGLDHRSGNLDAVEEAEAGVGDVEIGVDGSPSRSWTVTALDGSSRSRHTLESGQTDAGTIDTDDAIAFSPGAAASMNETPRATDAAG